MAFYERPYMPFADKSHGIQKLQWRDPLPELLPRLNVLWAKSVMYFGEAHYFGYILARHADGESNRNKHKLAALKESSTCSSASCTFFSNPKDNSGYILTQYICVNNFTKQKKTKHWWLFFRSKDNVKMTGQIKVIF